MALLPPLPLASLLLLLLLLLLLQLALPAAANVNFSIGWTFTNNISSNPSGLLHLAEYHATALCHPHARSLHFQLCFFNTSHNAFTFSILTYHPNRPEDSRVVWSLDRDNPVTEHAFFSFNTDGTGALYDASGSLVSSTQTAYAGISTMVLTDDGFLGFVAGNASSYIWKSSRHPTDVLQPVSYLISPQSLYSRVSDTNGSTGIYSLVVETGGFALYAALPIPLPYWQLACSGPNNSYSITHPSDKTLKPVLNVGFDGRIYSGGFGEDSSMIGKLGTACNHTLKSGGSLRSSLSFLRLESSGNLRAYFYDDSDSRWVVTFDLFESNLCLLPNSCPSTRICTIGVPHSNVNCACPRNETPSQHNFSSATCSLSPTLACDTSQFPRSFLPVTGVDYFPNTYTLPTQTSTEDGCKQSCIENCSCVAAFYRLDTHSCFTYPGPLGTLLSVPNSSNYLAFLAVVEERVPTTGLTRKTIVAITASLAITLLAAVAVSSLFFWRRRQARSQRSWLDLVAEVNILDLSSLPTRFKYKDIKSMTNNFSEWLGAGGFGSVYRGSLPAGGRQVAVKRLESMKQGAKQFHAEVAVLGSIHHFNLVGLCGFCAEGSHRLLVYEYMSQGALDRWLFEEESGLFLSWEQRYVIALGTAKGLAYLHEECKHKIIHLDVKPQNILLDTDFTAKLSDFGLARLMSRDQSFVVTTMRGTPGYLAPEWLLESAITEKADVYSFGMVLLEMVSGRRNMEPALSGAKRYYPTWALRKAMEGSNWVELVDERLEGMSEEQELQAARMIQIGLLCIQQEPSWRPGMGNVVQMLEATIQVPRLSASMLHHLVPSSGSLVPSSGSSATVSGNSATVY